MSVPASRTMEVIQVQGRDTEPLPVSASSVSAWGRTWRSEPLESLSNRVSPAAGAPMTEPAEKEMAPGAGVPSGQSVEAFSRRWSVLKGQRPTRTSPWTVTTRHSSGSATVTASGLRAFG